MNDVAEHVRRANRLYDERLKLELEPGNPGKVVAIHVETGEYFLGDTPKEACTRGRASHPGAVFVCRRVGNGPLCRVGTF
jgi:hypothetical protein